MLGTGTYTAVYNTIITKTRTVSSNDARAYNMFYNKLSVNTHFIQWLLDNFIQIYTVKCSATLTNIARMLSYAQYIHGT